MPTSAQTSRCSAPTAAAPGPDGSRSNYPTARDSTSAHTTSSRPSTCATAFADGGGAVARELALGRAPELPVPLASSRTGSGKRSHVWWPAADSSQSTSCLDYPHRPSIAESGQSKSCRLIGLATPTSSSRNAQLVVADHASVSDEAG